MTKIHNQEDESRFNMLMAKYASDQDAAFTIDEIKFLGMYKLTSFAAKFPGVAEFYMSCIDD